MLTLFVMVCQNAICPLILLDYLLDYRYVSATKDTDELIATTDVTPLVIENDVLILTMANMVVVYDL